MSEVLSTGPSWKGFQSIGRLIIFGDSYSSVTGTWYNDYDALASTPDLPLGCEFPGDALWNESHLPNWVGHLITKYRPGPKYQPPGTDEDEEDEEAKLDWNDNPLVVHDYARGGDTIDGVKRQIEWQFLPKLGARTEINSTAEESLFFIWVGINDCGMGLLPEFAMEKLTKLLNELYLVGARNFVVADVPPVQRTPAVPEKRIQGIINVIDRWNSDLRKTLDGFVKEHSDTSTFLYSSSAFFNALLDDPVSYGFKGDETKKRGGEMWIDHIHPTSQVHDCLARDLANFLGGIPAATAITSPQ